MEISQDQLALLVQMCDGPGTGTLATPDIYADVDALVSFGLIKDVTAALAPVCGARLKLIVPTMLGAELALYAIDAEPRTHELVN